VNTMVGQDRVHLVQHRLDQRAGSRRQSRWSPSRAVLVSSVLQAALE
jgi:hypothetical protein